MCAFFHKIVTLNMGTYMNIIPFLKDAQYGRHQTLIREIETKQRMTVGDLLWISTIAMGGRWEKVLCCQKWIQAPIECAATYNWASSEPLLFVKWMNFRILSSLRTGIRAKKLTMDCETLEGLSKGLVKRSNDHKRPQTCRTSKAWDGATTGHNCPCEIDLQSA